MESSCSLPGIRKQVGGGGVGGWGGGRLRAQAICSIQGHTLSYLNSTSELFLYCPILPSSNDYVGEVIHSLGKSEPL